MTDTLRLTAKQIEALYEFTQADMQPIYTITTGSIYDGDNVVYEGLMAYSDSEDRCVLQLEE